MKKSTKRNLRKAQRTVTRVLLVVATVVALGMVTVEVSKPFATQTELVYIYNEIDKSEGFRDYYAEKATDSSLSAGYRKSLQSQADSYDLRIKELSERRYNLQNSDEELVAWSAKNGFEWSIFVASLAVETLLIAACVWIFRNRKKVLDVEELVCNFVLHYVFLSIAFILYIFAYFFGNCAKCFRYRKRKNSQKKPQKSQRQDVIYFNRNRRVG